MEAWNPGLDLGVPEIDTAHQELDKLMVVAVEAVQKNAASAVEAVLISYYEATQAHFVVEEGLMRQSGFGGDPAHQTAHAAYLKDIEGARKQFASDGLSPVFQLWFASRLAPWFRLHIRGSDAQFVRHYKAWQEGQAKAAEAALIATAKK